jgi:hypothetical protein
MTSNARGRALDGIAAWLVVSGLWVLCGGLAGALADERESILPSLVGQWNNVTTGLNIEVRANGDVWQQGAPMGRGTGGTIDRGGNFAFEGRDSNSQPFRCVYYVTPWTDGKTNWTIVFHDGEFVCPSGIYAPVPGRLRVDGPELTFSGVQGGPFDPTSQSLHLLSEGFGFRWSLQGNLPDWVNVAPSQGEISDYGQVPVTVSLTPAAVAKPPGIYDADIKFRSRGYVIERKLRLVVNPPQPGEFRVDSPDLITFAGSPGGTFGPTEARIALSSHGRGFRWSIQDNAPDWLNISPKHGELKEDDKAEVTLSLLPAATIKAVGSYDATLIFGGSGKLLLRTARLVVTGPPQPPNGKLLTDTQDEIVFTLPQGGPVPTQARTLGLSVEGRGLQWAMQGNAPDWLSVSQTKGVLADNGSTQINLSLLAPAGARMAGSDSVVLAFRSPSGSEIQRMVRLTVIEPGELRVNLPEPVIFTGSQDGSIAPPDVRATISSHGHGFHWSIQSNAAEWLSVSPREGDLKDDGKAEVALSVLSAARSKPPGTYDATLTFNGPTGPIQRTVRLVIERPPGRITSDSPELVTFTGAQNGSFGPAESRMRLVALGRGFHWSMLDNAPDWLSVSPKQGDLKDDEAAQVTLSLSPAASRRPPGTYEATLLFSGPGPSNSVARTVRLVVIEPPPGQLSVAGPSSGPTDSFARFVGAPFNPPEIKLKLAVSGRGFGWSSIVQNRLIEIAPTAGVLADGSSVEVTIKPSAAGSLNKPGRYTERLTFQNNGRSVGVDFPVQLTVLDPEAECDRLMGNRFDPDRPSSAPFVVDASKLSDAEIDLAVSACKVAVQNKPPTKPAGRERRFIAQLGRAVAAHAERQVGAGDDDAARSEMNLAVTFWQTGENLGSSAAMNFLGVHYNGTFNEEVGKPDFFIKPDPKLALEHFAKGATAKNATAMRNYGSLLLGDSDPPPAFQNVALGISWLGKAIEAGDRQAANILGTAYYFGAPKDKVPQNVDKALGLFAMACANQDDQVAQNSAKKFFDKVTDENWSKKNRLEPSRRPAGC